MVLSGNQAYSTWLLHNAINFTENPLRTEPKVSCKIKIIKGDRLCGYRYNSDYS